MKKKYADMLNKYAIFHNLSHDEIAEFSTKIKVKSIKEGQVIIKEGDVGDSLIFLLSGEVSITKALTLNTNSMEEDAREKELIRIKSEYHSVFGEISLFSENDARTATITALTNCDIGILMKHDFFDISDKKPEVGYKITANIAKILSKNLIDTNHQVLKLTTAFSLILDK